MATRSPTVAPAESVVTVSGANARSGDQSTGADFGPDSFQNATPGVQGNGSPTSTGGIQEALNWAKSHPGVTKVLVTGNVTVSATINVPSQVVIEIVGTIILASGPQNTQPMFQASGAQSVEIRGGTLCGNGVYVGNSKGLIELTGATDCSVHDLTITNASCWGINLKLGDKNRVYSVRIVNPGYDGLVCTDTGTLLSNVYIEGAGAGGVAGDGLTFYRGARFCAAVGCAASDCIGTGFTMGSNAGAITSDCVFEACLAYRNKNHGFYVGYQDNSPSDVSRCVVANCLASNNNLDGIYLLRAQDCAVHGNICADNSQNPPLTYVGIQVADDGAVGSSFNMISGNLCFDNQPAKTQQRGFSMGSLSAHNTVRDNDFRRNSLPPLLNMTGPGNVVGGNHGYNPQGFAVLTPGGPKVTNTNPFAVRIYILASYSGAYSITDPEGINGPFLPCVPGHQIVLDVGATITTTGAVTWKWYGT